MYHDNGTAAAENEVVALKAQFISAVHGMHPLTLEPVTAKRRAVERSIALHVLVQSGERLRSDEQSIRQQLDDGNQQLRAIVLNAVAQGLLRADQIPLTTDAEVDGLWALMAARPILALAAKQVMLLLHPMDVRILLIDLIGPT